MNIHVFSSMAFLWCLYLQYSEASKQCVRIQDSPLASCAVAGYNYTYPLPDGMSQRTISLIKRFMSYVTTKAANCSVAQIAETIVCMKYAPKCVDANKEPLLPCKRVCSELFKRCSSSVDNFVLHYMFQLCMLLPDDTAASGKCYEPKQFDQHFNATYKGPLERGCQKLVNFPFCDGMGYSYTIVTPERQLQEYEYFYGKNITDPNPNTPAPGSPAEKFQLQLKNSPRCGENIKKLFCAEVTPPCFPDERPAYYTVCQPVCREIVKQCPDVIKGLYSFYGRCERMASGTASHGYCKHTKMPSITYWHDYLKAQPTASPTRGLSTAVIVIISIVIPAVVIIIIAIVIVHKKRKPKDTYTYQRQELG